jgi:hypothetical protein
VGNAEKTTGAEVLGTSAWDGNQNGTLVAAGTLTHELTPTDRDRKHHDLQRRCNSSLFTLLTQG